MLTQLVADYGYLGVLVGSVLEGETVLVLAGFAAHQGYLSFLWVVVIAWCGGVLGDQALFFLGRRYGAQLLRRFPHLNPGVQRVNGLLQRQNAKAIIGVRFMYGLRTVGLIAIGMSDVPVWRFVVLNLIGAALWAPLFGGLGYLFGNTLEWLFADIKRYEDAVLALIVGAALVLGLARRLRRRAVSRGV